MVAPPPRSFAVADVLPAHPPAAAADAGAAGAVPTRGGGRRGHDHRRHLRLRHRHRGRCHLAGDRRGRRHPHRRRRASPGGSRRAPTTTPRRRQPAPDASNAATAPTRRPSSTTEGAQDAPSAEQPPMKRRSLIISLVAIVAVAIGGLVATFASAPPQLGLDLQGGASVTLQPEGDAARRVARPASPTSANRIDALGVAEPEIIRQGNTVVVNLPGIKDQDRALAARGPDRQAPVPARAGRDPVARRAAPAATTTTPARRRPGRTARPATATTPAPATTTAAGAPPSPRRRPRRRPLPSTATTQLAADARRDSTQAAPGRSCCPSSRATAPCVATARPGLPDRLRPLSWRRTPVHPRRRCQRPVAWSDLKLRRREGPRHVEHLVGKCFNQEADCPHRRHGHRARRDGDRRPVPPDDRSSPTPASGLRLAAAASRRRGQGPGPRAQVRRRAGRAQAPGRPDRFGHARARTRCGPA